MTAHLPPSLLALFAPRPPIPYLPPIEKRKCTPLTGMAHFVQYFEDPSTVVEKPKQEFVNPKLKIDKQQLYVEEIGRKLKEWDPQKNQNATENAYKSLFVARLSYETTESRLKREFEEFGPIKKVRIIYDNKTGKSRGYGFIEYEKERDMKEAYKYADGKKIDGRRVLVDVERGRTKKEWKPRKFGGGLGATRAGGTDVNQRYSGREPPRSSDKEDKKERRRDDKSDKRERDDHRRERDGEKEDRDSRSSRKDREGREREESSSSKERTRERERDRR